jgi:hypothetical protein
MNRYKRDYERLRELKGEIEFMQMTLEKSRAQLTRDFESWFAIMERQAGGGAAASAADAAAPSLSSAPASAARAPVAVAKQVHRVTSDMSLMAAAVALTIRSMSCRRCLSPLRRRLPAASLATGRLMRILLRFTSET